MRAVVPIEWTRLRPGMRVMAKRPDNHLEPAVGTVVRIQEERPRFVLVEFSKSWKAPGKITRSHKKQFQLPPEYIIGEVSA